MVKHAHARFLNPYGPGGSSSTPFSCDRPAGGMSSRWGPGGRLHHHASAAWWRAPQLPGLLLLALGVLLAWGGSMCVLAWALAPPAPQRPPLPEYMLAPVLVSYAYYEKDATQLANFEFFLAVGSQAPPLHSAMHWVYVVSGEACTPCARLHGTLDAGSSRAGSSSRLGREQQHAPTASAASPDLARLGLREARAGDTFSLLVRGENVGMDLGGHNTTLEWLRHRRRLGSYAYFIFLNSSVKGPFMPAWVPSHWHWTYAFLAAFQPSGAAAAGGGSGASSGRSSSSSGRGADALPGYSQQQQQQQAAAQAGAGGAGGGPPRPVHAVGASLVCLPADDAGGPGPRLESWAFALDQPGLAAAVARGVFRVRGCKLCGDADAGVVVGGEYGITTAMFAAGYNIATLLSRYARGLDWSDPRHWACNDNAHASRAGLYGGISQHPYETVFVKSSWHVAEPYTRRYSAWQLAHLLGKAGTEGTYNRALYRFGISAAAEHPRDLEAAYRALTAQ